MRYRETESAYKKRTQSAAPDFGSLYGVKIRAGDIKAVNDYAGETESDASKLANITNAAPGSTCLFSNGSLYRLELSGWKKFGESGTSQAAASTNSLNLSPLNIGRNVLLDNADVQENELEYVGDETGEELEAIEVEPGEFGEISSDMR